MSRYRRSKAEETTYFFTVNTYLRQSTLTHPAVRATLREGIEHVPFMIDAWVLLHLPRDKPEAATGNA